MTEKEKAKAYDEALERAKKLYGKGITEEIFPELKEDDDEKIRKKIISILRNAYWTSNKNRFNELVAWLEKQGKEEYGLKSFKDEDVRKFMQYIEKQAKAYEFNLPNRSYDIYAFAKDILVWLEKQDKNYTDKIEPKFKVGDWVVNKFGDSWYIDSLDKKNYQVSDGKGNYNYFPISKQDEMHFWTVQDAKDGDIICYRDEISLYKNEIENCNKEETTFGGFVYYCCYDGKRFITNSFYLLTGQDEIDIYPATKEQHDLLFQKIKEAGYKWNVKTKTLDKLVKPKFDPKTLQPFDRILGRLSEHCKWTCGFFSYADDNNFKDTVNCMDHYITNVIPYNEETKHLVGTKEEAPDFYRYWED